MTKILSKKETIETLEALGVKSDVPFEDMNTSELKALIEKVNDVKPQEKPEVKPPVKTAVKEVKIKSNNSLAEIRAEFRRDYYGRKGGKK